MKNVENCIQLKIDQLLTNVNPKDGNKIQQEEINEVVTLMSYNHCLDLFEFLGNFFKVQKNEVLFQIAFIYDIFGYNQLALEYANEALEIIPNVPTIILFKSALFARMNKFEDAQKFLLKYKYLIGEDIFYNYIYNNIRIIYFYLLEYEENIILREISLIENKYPNYYNNNIILFFIKSKILQKLSEKLKQSDKKRSYIYQKDSIQNKEKALNNRKFDAEYLYKYDIVKDNITKIIMMIYPNFIEYKPKALIHYNPNFHTGFGLFFTLFKICKIFKFRIEIINKKRNLNNDKKENIKMNSKSNSFYNNENNLNKDLNNSKKKNDEIKESQNELYELSKSVYLENYINNNISSNKDLIKKKKIKEISQNNKNNFNNINYKIKTNYFIYNGFYSNLNLQKSILNNIDFNNEYKAKILGKDSLLDDENEFFKNNIRKNKSNNDILLNLNKSFNKENELNIFKNKLIGNKKNKIKFIQTIQNKHHMNIDKIIEKKEIINTNEEKEGNKEEKNFKKYINKDKEKLAKNNNSNKKIDEIKTNTNKRNNKNSNNNNYIGSYKNLINNNDIINYKKQYNEINNIFKYNKDNNIKNIEKSNKNKIKLNYNNKFNDNKLYLFKNTKNANSVNNIFNNIIIFDSNNMKISRNKTKPYININNKPKSNENKNEKYNTNDSNMDKDFSKELTIVNESEKKQETINNISNNNIVNQNDNNKLYIYKINNLNHINYDIQSNRNKILNKNNNNIEKNEKMNIHFFVKKKEKKELSKKYIKEKIIEKINQTEKLEDNKKFKHMVGMEFAKSSINKNKNNNIINNNSNKLKNKIFKKDITLEKNTYNTISLKEYAKKNQNKNTNNMSYKNINKIFNNNIHNKIKTYLDLRPIKENPKSAHKKGSELSLKEKEKGNFLTINLDFITKSKVGTPTYQKLSLFGSNRSDSKDKKKQKINKNGLSIKSPNYMIRLRRKFKNKSKINYNGPKSSFNKYVNNNMTKKSIHYFNNIINISEVNKNKNSSYYKLKHNSTNKSTSKNNIITVG